MTETFLESVPFLICMFIVLALVTLIPAISLFLPSLMIGV
ncbi:hypothetical protein ACFQ3K_17365 [Brucella gallinifaecis]